jgi:hypothetical protein
MLTRSNWLFLSMLVLAPATSLAASKEAERPDKDMLRMMDFLRDLEVIKHMEMMKDMQQVEQVGGQAPRGTAQTTTPAKKKEAAK